MTTPSSGGPNDPTAPLTPPAASPGPGGVYRPFEPGTEIGEFRILRVLGAGGMGTVYEAEQQNPRRRVALKVIRGWAASDEADLRMFAREIESLARLKHPNIATIYSSGRTEDGMQYFAMELVAGRTLDQHLQASGGFERVDPDEIERRLRLLITLCRAVGYAHQRGVIHRDLKPGNVMVSDDAPPSTDSTASSSSFHGPVIKVLDFGLARITDSDVHATRATEISSVLGTLAYMSPEQASGRVADLDLRTDVYSLGVLLYESLTGQRPLDLSHIPFVEALRRLTQEKPRPLEAAWRGRRSLDSDLSTIVMKALAGEPAERYESAIALADDLERYLEGQPIQARPASGLYQLKKLASRHRGAVAAGMAGLVLIVGFAVTMTVQARRIAEERDRATAEAARAEANSRFLRETIGAADPWGGGGVDVTIRDVLDEAAKRIDTTFKDQPLLRAEAAMAIAATEGSLGRFERAESLSAVVVDIRRNELRQSGLPVAGALYDAGHYAWLNANGAKSDSLLLQALQEVEIARNDHPRERAAADTVEFKVLSTYGQNLIQLGRYADAESVAAKLSIQAVRLDGPRGLRNSTAYNVRSNLATALEQFPLADSMTNMEYELVVQHYGARHPFSLTAMNNMALNKMYLGDYAKAESLYTALIRDMGEVLGPEHPMLARSIENLGNIYFRSGRYPEAVAMLDRVRAIRSKGLGEDHITIYRTMANMGAIYRRTGESEKSIDAYTKALGGFERSMGTGHPEIATVLTGRGLEWETQGRLELAELDLARALDIRRQRFPDDHPALAASRINYGLILAKLGREAAAESLLARGLEVRDLSTPADDALSTRARTALNEVRSRGR